MTNVTVTLPDSMKEFVEEQVARNGYSTPGEYLQALIRDAQLRAEKEDLEAKLLAGLESPLSDMTREDWTGLRRRILDRNPGLSDE